MFNPAEKAGPGGADSEPPQQRQRQADPGLWPISLAYLMRCKPVRDLASQTKSDGNLRNNIQSRSLASHVHARGPSTHTHTNTPTCMCTHMYTHTQEVPF